MPRPAAPSLPHNGLQEHRDVFAYYQSPSPCVEDYARSLRPSDAQVYDRPAPLPPCALSDIVPASQGTDDAAGVRFLSFLPHLRFPTDYDIAHEQSDAGTDWSPYKSHRCATHQNHP